MTRDICQICGADVEWDDTKLTFVCHDNHRNGTVQSLDLTKTVAECVHENFVAHTNIGRMLDSGMFIADIRIRCAQCGEPFRFVGVPAGLDFSLPTCTVDGLGLHAPIEPEGQKMLHTSARFVMPEIPPRH